MKHRNIEQESFLYKIVEELSRDNAPIIFKGGLALKDLLYINNPDLNIDRKTIDIDANWTENYDLSKINYYLENAIKKIAPNYKLVLYREANDNKSMGFNVINEEEEIITKIDLDIKDNPFYVICNVNDVEIKYSSLEKIMADKLSSISNEHIFRRTKDILDTYLIVKNNKVDVDKIKDILDFDGRKLGDFSTMLSNKDILEESYKKLTGISNKPEFSEVWEIVTEYLEENELIINKKEDYEMEM